MARLAAMLAVSLLFPLHPGCKKKPTAADGAPSAVAPSAAPARPLSWREGLKSPDAKARAEACKSILPIDLPAPPPELLAALSDPDAAVRKACIKGVLGFVLEYADASGVPKLLEIAEKDPVVEVRAEAIRVIGALAHRDVVPGLVKVFEKEKNEAVRDEILAIFAREGDQRALPVLLPLLEAKDPPPLVFEALRGIAHPKAVGPLLPLLENPAGAIRSRAIQVLGDLGDHSAAPKLVKALLDKEPTVVREAINGVAQLGSAEAVGPLLKLSDHPDAKVRLSAIRALATYRFPEVIPAKDALPRVLKHLKKDTDRIRIEAARVLGAVKIQEAVPALREAASAANPRDVRRAALEALGQIGDPGALPTLSEAVADKDPDVRTSAAIALGQLGKAGRPAAGALQEAWKRNEPDIDARIEIVRALGKTGAEDAAALLLDAGEKDPVPLVRVEAGGALLTLGRDEGLKVIRPILTGAADWQERRAAAKVLDVASPVTSVTDLIWEALQSEKEPLVREELFRKLGAAVGESAARFQRKALGERVPFFRLMAADGLCGNGDPAGCQALVKSLQDPEARVRAESARRLGALKVGEAASALRATLGDPVIWVANAARQALAKLGGAANNDK
jgi:HEAT repeat protein